MDANVDETTTARQLAAPALQSLLTPGAVALCLDGIHIAEIAGGNSRACDLACCQVPVRAIHAEQPIRAACLLHDPAGPRRRRPERLLAEHGDARLEREGGLLAMQRARRRDDEAVDAASEQNRELCAISMPQQSAEASSAAASDTSEIIATSARPLSITASSPRRPMHPRRGIRAAGDDVAGVPLPRS